MVEIAGLMEYVVFDGNALIAILTYAHPVLWKMKPTKTISYLDDTQINGLPSRKLTKS